MYRAHPCPRRTSLILATASLISACFGVVVTDRGHAALGSQQVHAGENLLPEQLAESTPDFTQLVNEAFSLRESTIVTLQIDTTPGAEQSIIVPIDGEEHTLELSPHSVRAESYQVLIESPDGTVVRLEPSPVRTVRGAVLEIADSVVAGAVQEDGLHLLIRLTAEDTYWLQPIGTLVDGAAAGAHVLYRQDDVIPSGGRCGNDAAAVSEHVNQADASRRAMGSETCGVAELGTDADQEFLDAHGGTPEGVENRINFIINTVNLQYESQVEISHLITAVLIHTNPPTPPEESYPYTSTNSTTLLNQFRNHWLNEHSDIPRDLAFLFAGKPAVGGAFCIGCICTSSSFALSSTDCCSDACATDFTAHQLGHLWDAIHCNCPNCTMRTPGNCSNVFCPEAVEAIIAHRDSRSCLDCPDPAPTTLPFFDDFPTTTLNLELWTNASVEINDLGIGEPSEPYSVNLDFVDDLRSTLMDTSGKGNLELSYWYQAGWDNQAPEVGDDLFVEYLSVAHDWKLLSAHLGQGPVNLPFQFVQISLPADAQYDGFRFRFRADNSAPQDEWFVDDVFVGILPQDATTELPFIDNFPSTEINSELWIGVEGASIDDQGAGEPSAPWSLNIDGVDEIRSAIMDTTGAVGLTLNYSWQQTGDGGDTPEASDLLMVEYLNDQGEWVEINSHPGAGPDAEPYEMVSLPLPGDALHDSFRFRFRGTGTVGGQPQGFDDWFVDDVFVGELPSGPPGDLDGDGSVGAADLAILLGNWGPCADCADCPADLDGDCTVGAADLAILLGNWG